MKKTVNEAYPKRNFTPKNNGGKSKRYIKAYVKRLTSASDAAQPSDAAADPSAPAVKPKEVIQITLKNIGSDDAQQIKDTLISDDIITECFVCDLSRCKGECCLCLKLSLRQGHRLKCLLCHLLFLTQNLLNGLSLCYLKLRLF